MNTKRALRWSGLGVAGALLVLAATPGCELLVSFDRSKIPEDGGTIVGEGGGDGSTSDATVNDTGSDAPAQQETGSDAPAGDAGPDVTTDAPTADSPSSDAAETGTTDAPVDSHVADAPVDSPVDTGVDAPVDTGVDAPAEAADDGSADAGSDVDLGDGGDAGD